MQASTPTIINLNELKTYQSVVTLPKYGCISVVGEDASTFLQGQLTCDVTTLTINTANRGSICTHKGRMIASFYIRPQENGFWMILPRNNMSNFLEHIQKFAAFSKVTLEDASNHWNVIGIIGAMDTPKNSIRLELTDDFDRAFCLTQASNTSWQTNNTWQGLNVLANIADVDAHTTELFTPQMIDLQKSGGVSFSKGCYVGQEVIARTENLGKLKRHQRYLQLPLGNATEIGQPVKNDKDETIGVVTEYYADDEYAHVLAVIEDRLFES